MNPQLELHMQEFDYLSISEDEQDEQKEEIHQNAGEAYSLDTFLLYLSSVPVLLLILVVGRLELMVGGAIALLFIFQYYRKIPIHQKAGEAHGLAPYLSSVQQTQCRLELSKILGAIGAPLLLEKNTTLEELIDQRPTTVNNTTMSDCFTLLIELAQSHAELLKVLDISMDILKSGASLQLGATHSTVERVERNLYGRRRAREHNQPETTSDSATSTLNFPVSFYILRTLLSQAMLYQANSLESILRRAQRSNSSDTESHCVATADGGVVDRSAQNSMIDSSHLLGEIPQVITLTWLRSSRGLLLELLSDVLNEVSADPSSILCNDNEGLELLRKSVSRAKEMQEHLASSLCLKDEENSLNHEKKLQEELDSSNLQMTILEMRKKVHSLYIACWAMEDAARQLRTTSSEQQDDNTLEDWWTRIQELNEDVNASLQEMDATFYRGEVGSASGDEKEDQVQPNASPVSLSKDIVSELVDIPSQLEQRKLNLSKSTKTAVFSGKGALEPPKPKKSEWRQGSLSNVEDGPLASAAFNPDPVAQHMLLGELRKRLKTLPLPEEEHETDDIGDGDQDESVRNEKTTAVPSFAGINGMLLVGELKNAIAMPDNCTIGDDQSDSASASGQ